MIVVSVYCLLHYTSTRCLPFRYLAGADALFFSIVRILFIFEHFVCVADMPSISGYNFINALQRLGCENLNKFTGQSFAWVFDCEPLWPFFDWFCTELQTLNVLKLSELEQ